MLTCAWFCPFGPTGPSPHGHTVHVWTSQPSVSTEAAAGRREARTSPSPHRVGAWGSAGRLRKARGLCSATGVSSKCVSLPVMPEQDSSAELIQTHICLRSWRSCRSQDESGRGGEREADSLKNSQCPAKACWAQSWSPCSGEGSVGAQEKF